MTAFFKKYKWKIFYWAILSFFFLYFAPKQSKYYLDQDIKEFKAVYLIPTMVWVFGLIAIGLFIFWLIKTKSFKQSIAWFFSTALAFTFIIFFFQSIFAGIALFANRLTTKEKVIKTYQAAFTAGTDNSKNSFSLYDPSKKHFLIDKKLINKLYQPGVKRNDTLTLPMNKGLLGIAFSSYQLEDE